MRITRSWEQTMTFRNAAWFHSNRHDCDIELQLDFSRHGKFAATHLC